MNVTCGRLPEKAYAYVKPCFYFNIFLTPIGRNNRHLSNNQLGFIKGRGTIITVPATRYFTFDSHFSSFVSEYSVVVVD